MRYFEDFKLFSLMHKVKVREIIFKNLMNISILLIQLYIYLFCLAMCSQLLSPTELLSPLTARLGFVAGKCTHAYSFK